jgi:hypothetical protein
MIFATTCFGEDRKSDVLHFLNDLRNLSYKVYVITNIDLEIEKLQFDNVNIIKVDVPFYHDFFRYKLMKQIFENETDEYIYYLDCDTRFINCREEKFDKDKFELLIRNKSFDILNAWMCDSVSLFFEHPDNNENKSIRQFKYGYETFITWMSDRFPNFREYMGLQNTWEGHLILKKSDKLMMFLETMIEIGDILIDEDIKNGRQEVACCSSALITLLSNLYNLNLQMDSITHHFFKCNFLREVFPFNFNINRNEKVLPSNDILL